MQKLKIPEKLKLEAEKFAKLNEEARELTNAANRQKTSLKNKIKDFWDKSNLPIGSYIRLGGKEYTYEAATKEVIDTSTIIEMYDNGDISREALLDMVKIDKSVAANKLGADVVADLTTKVPGNTIDVRFKNLPVENLDDEYIAVVSKVKVKTKRKVFGAKVKNNNGKKIRRIKLRGK